MPSRAKHQSPYDGQDKARQIVTARKQAEGQPMELLATDHVTCGRER